jgi:hypothetical protein
VFRTALLVLATAMIWILASQTFAQACLSGPSNEVTRFYSTWRVDNQCPFAIDAEYTRIEKGVVSQHTFMFPPCARRQVLQTWPDVEIIWQRTRWEERDGRCVDGKVVGSSDVSPPPKPTLPSLLALADQAKQAASSAPSDLERAMQQATVPLIEKELEERTDAAEADAARQPTEEFLRSVALERMNRISADIAVRNQEEMARLAHEAEIDAEIARLEAEAREEADQRAAAAELDQLYEESVEEQRRRRRQEAELFEEFADGMISGFDPFGSDNYEPSYDSGGGGWECGPGPGSCAAY